MQDVNTIKKTWKQTQGRRFYIKFLKKETITRKEAMLAKCAECCSGYMDGMFDCEVNTCPMYPFMPYRGKKEIEK